MEQTCVLLKPDSLQRGLVGEIIHRFERKGLKLKAIKMMTMSEELINNWYAHHREKDFFKDIQRFMTSTPIVAMIWEGVGAIAAVRKIVGVTKGREAEGGSIRGDFGMSGSQNLIHASDSQESARKEIGLIFAKEEIFNYQSAVDCLIYSPKEIV